MLNAGTTSSDGDFIPTSSDSVYLLAEADCQQSVVTTTNDAIAISDGEYSGTLGGQGASQGSELNLVDSLATMSETLDISYTESFESGLGFWTQGTDDDGDWILQKNGTPSSYTGPSGAHDGSYYLYTEASPASPGGIGYPNKSACLDAHFDLSALSSPELTFYYHMYGSGMGTLYVGVYDGNGYTNAWYRTGQQHEGVSDPWAPATVDLSDYAGMSDVQIRFRGVTGSSYRSDMAIDSISISDETNDVDFGDAPDTGSGTGPGNYNTLASDNGPTHTILAGLHIGASVDADDGTLQNATANADDTSGTDDEDGLNNPTADLTIAVGSQPTVDVTVTNTTGATATLFGWIDYNNDGLFDNATERAQAAVATGTNDGMVTLTFPTVPTGFLGTTYARFRLSTDAAAANATGAASDGEVEDYVASIELAPPVLAGEPATTPGTENTIYWSSVAGANEYYAEYDNDPDFGSPEGSSGWISDTSHTFVNLTPGITYHYRVMARGASISSFMQDTQPQWETHTSDSLEVVSNDSVASSGQTP